LCPDPEHRLEANQAQGDFIKIPFRTSSSSAIFSFNPGSNLALKIDFRSRFFSSFLSGFFS